MAQPYSGRLSCDQILSVMNRMTHQRTTLILSELGYISHVQFYLNRNSS